MYVPYSYTLPVILSLLLLALSPFHIPNTLSLLSLVSRLGEPLSEKPRNKLATQPHQLGEHINGA
jgi:hypothetical protein